MYGMRGRLRGSYARATSYHPDRLILKFKIPTADARYPTPAFHMYVVREIQLEFHRVLW